MADTQPDHPTISAQEALQRLIEGNERFLCGEARFPTVCKETLADLARGQHPYATILGCSDSRVPPSSFSTPTLASSSSFASPAMSSLRKSWAACSTLDRICTHRYSSSWVIRDAALSLLHSIPRRMAPSISRVSGFWWMASSPDSPTQIRIFPPKRNLKKRWKRTFAGPSANCSLRRKERAP